MRAAEVTAVLADIAGPGARRLDVAAAFGLVRGGWATRWREHPPLRVYLGYRLYDRPIPVEYREWARDDIEGRAPAFSPCGPTTRPRPLLGSLVLPLHRELRSHPWDESSSM
ncbi:hypothetical protein BH11ACT1_BH11ACT1_16650 [soil metagenome]